MPRGDRTGPWGMGPMTGRAAGLCAGYGVPGYMNPGPGAGRGRYGGGGRGHRNWYWATGLTGWQRAPMAMPPYGPPVAPYSPGPDQELSFLRDQVKLMQDSLASAQERIQELEKDTDQK
jgi:hypothetical protein